ncbi:hypothetical protein ACFYNZ_21665 [Streptomyces kebangsaanensis]|uniref:Uncharacterized protein n=1 Tax=Streptomyces kebangsaanensis TaxID=864058 RepID=A0ABW6KXE5_9ACTN
MAAVTGARDPGEADGGVEHSVCTAVITLATAATGQRIGSSG